MQNLANKWKALLQTQSNEQLKFSKLGSTSKKQDESKSKNRESLIDESSQHNKKSKERLDKFKQQKNKNSRTISNQKRKQSNAKAKENTEHFSDTPSKLKNRKPQKIIERYTNAISELLDQNQAIRLGGKIKGLLEDMATHIQSQGMTTSSLRISVGDRAYHQLQQKYFQSQKQRQYLRGKMQISAKRYEGLQRQLQRYSKIEKLIDSSILRENELRQEIARLKTEKGVIQAQMQQQKQMFRKEVDCIRELIQSLKVHLPLN